MTERLPPERFLSLAEAGRGDDAIDEVLGLARQGFRVADVVEEVLSPIQAEVGRRWQTDQYSVAQEHLVSGLIEDVLGLLRIHAPQPHTTHTLPLVCATGEWHTTPARMAALILRDHGWRVQFLGGSLPPDHLGRALDELAPPALAVSCTLSLALPGAGALVAVAHDRDIPVLVGGAAFAPDPHRARLVGADGYARSAADAARQLTAWLDQPPALAASGLDADREAQSTALAEQRQDLMERAYLGLEARLMATFTAVQRDHVRTGLHDLLRFLEVAVLFDDPELFLDSIAWLRDVLHVRGIPPAVLAGALHLLESDLPDRGAQARRLLLAARAEVAVDRGVA